MASPKLKPQKTTKAAPKKTVKRKVVKKAKTIVMVSPVDEMQRFVVASEFEDDALIERELAGDILPTFIYQFEDKDGETVTGLSSKGVNEVVRRLNKNPRSGSKIRINPQYLTKEEVEREGEKGIEVSVFGEDLVTANSAWGIKFEPYFKVRKDGKRYHNTFAVEKALAKAERNAKRKLIAEGAATTIIQKLIKENGGANVKKIEAPKFMATAMKPAVPVASTPEALFKVIENAIKQSRDIDTLNDLDEKSQASDKMTKTQKKALHKLVKARIDELDGAPQ